MHHAGQWWQLGNLWWGLAGCAHFSAMKGGSKRRGGSSLIFRLNESKGTTCMMVSQQLKQTGRTDYGPLVSDTAPRLPSEHSSVIHNQLTLNSQGQRKPRLHKFRINLCIFWGKICFSYNCNITLAAPFYLQVQTSVSQQLALLPVVADSTTSGNYRAGKTLTGRRTDSDSCVSCSKSQSSSSLSHHTGDLILCPGVARTNPLKVTSACGLHVITRKGRSLQWDVFLCRYSN